MSNKVKIKDIAEKCGLSNTLVSLVLNNKASRYGIKTETQDKVLFVAKQMGYFGDAVTISVKKQKGTKNIIGLVIPDMKNSFLYRISPLLQSSFASIGMTLSIIPLNNREQEFDLLFDSIKKIYSGFILCGKSANDNNIRKLRNSNSPFVALENKPLKHRINAVSTDFEETVRLISDHISMMSYKRITLISPLSTVGIIDDMNVLEDELIKSDDQLKINNLTSEPYVSDKPLETNSFIELLPILQSTDLIITGDSSQVGELLKAFRTKNIRVPYDIAVMSVDDAPYFDLTEPQITHLGRDYKTMATKTSQVLWTEIKNEGKSKYKRTVTIKPEMVIRKSSGKF